MKKTGYGKVIMLALIFMAATCFSTKGFTEQTKNKIAFLDSQRVVDESKAGKEALKILEEFKKKNEEQLANKVKELTDMEEDLQKKKFALSTEAQKKMEESIRRKNIELKRFKEDKELELKDLYFSHLNEIKVKIVKIVQELGRQKEYSLILTKDDSIIYSDEALDITQLIIETYDKVYSLETETSEE